MLLSSSSLISIAEAEDDLSILSSSPSDATYNSSPSSLLEVILSATNGLRDLPVALGEGVIAPERLRLLVGVTVGLPCPLLSPSRLRCS